MNKKVIIPLATVLVVGGMIGFYLLKGKKVTAVKVEKKDYLEKLLVTGTVQSKEFSTLTSSIDGKIESIFIREGEAMKKGDIIAKLDSSQIEAEIAQGEALYRKALSDLETLEKQETENAKSNLKNAESNYKVAKGEFQKFDELFKKKYISELDYNVKKNAYSSAEAQLKTAKEQLASLLKGGALNRSALESVNAAKSSLESLKKNLEKYFIYAPYDGFVTARDVEVGQSVAPYSQMFQVSSNSEKIVSIPLDEKYINRVNLGATLKIYPYADNGHYSDGKLYYKGIDVDNSTGTLEIRGTLGEILPEFLYNSTVNVIIDGKEVKNGVLLQGIYVIPKKDKSYVLIEKSGKAHLQAIEGVHVIDGIVVTKGLETGDTVLSAKETSEGIRVSPQFAK